MLVWLAVCAGTYWSAPGVGPVHDRLVDRACGSGIEGHRIAGLLLRLLAPEAARGGHGILVAIVRRLPSRGGAAFGAAEVPVRAAPLDGLRDQLPIRGEVRVHLHGELVVAAVRNDLLPRLCVRLLGLGVHRELVVHLHGPRGLRDEQHNRGRHLDASVQSHGDTPIVLRGHWDVQVAVGFYLAGRAAFPSAARCSSLDRIMSPTRFLRKLLGNSLRNRSPAALQRT